MVGGKPSKTYAVGERPDNTGEINPLFTEQALRPGGVCSETQRSWEGVDPEIRKIILLAVKETGEIQVSDSDLRVAHDIIDLVTATDALTKVSQRFPRAVLRLAEMRNVGNEPSLRTPVRRSGGTGRNDPFFTKHVRT
jgi:hypothetical protein